MTAISWDFVVLLLFAQFTRKQNARFICVFGALFLALFLACHYLHAGADKNAEGARKSA